MVRIYHHRNELLSSMEGPRTMASDGKVDTHAPDGGMMPVLV